ncbi:type II inositol-1,4,5-trisphosphate 5-phosphatase [Xylariales sp. AK1849]|nr:type II inositol-1,4,5-trisphosphate 5-phosphatase [Xylariales sp. AK1849]
MPETVDLEEELHTSSTQYSLSRAVHARKAEYVRPHRIRIKVGSWNVAACPGTDKDLASWFVDGKGLEPHFDSHLSDQSLKASGTVESPHEDEETEPSIRLVGGSDIGLYVLGLQEIVSLNLIAGYTDTSATAKWQAALEAAMPPKYTHVASQQLSGLLLLIYASPEVAATLSSVSTVSVGTGLMGYMGNKGGISTRILLGETTRMVFTNSHLASGHDQTNLERRFWDYNRILSQTQFSPVEHNGVLEDDSEKIGDEDFAFWFGDLNFRLDDLPGDDIRRLLMLHTRGEYDLNKKGTRDGLDVEDGVIIMHNKDDNSNGSETPGMVSREASFDNDDDDNAELPDPDDFAPDPHDDPASLQATLDSLLPHDQLARTIEDRKAFHQGWREGPITFLPSYKYDVGTVGLFDSSEKRRAPSWCDRILFRSRTDLDAYKRQHADEEEAKKKDDDMKKRGIDTAADDESVLFDYDPENGSSSQPVDAHSYDYDEYDEGEDDAEGDIQAVTTKEGFQDRIRLDLYTTHQRITSSDHKPIVALFTLDYDAVVPELKAKVHVEVARHLDRAENEGRPSITIVADGKEGSSSHSEKDVTDGSGGVDHGDVGFKRPSTRSLTIANTGRVAATFCFVEKPGTQEDDGNNPRTSEPEWLRVSLQHSSISLDHGSDVEPGQEITLEPGETASALLTISVDSLCHLRSLNAGTASLEDVLVLRVTGGRDHFIPIRASWIPSCFGRGIEELIRVPPRSKGLRGFTEMLKQDKKGDGKEWRGGSIPYSLGVQVSSPTELYKLTEAIEKLTERVVADENMLHEDIARIPRNKAGWPFLESAATSDTDDRGSYRTAIIEALESDSPNNILDALPKTGELTALAQLELMSSILLLFLHSLVDGIITAPLFAKILTALPSLGNNSSSSTAKEVEDDKTCILDILSSAPYHNISFVFATSMLSKMAAELAPLSSKELELVNSDARTKAKGRTLSFRKVTNSISNGGDVVDEPAIQRRLAWERKAAEVFGPALCRSGTAGSKTAKELEKGRKANEERMRGLVDIFLRRRDGG